jgi:hypothetical protein
MSTHRTAPVAGGNARPLSVPPEHLGGAANHNTPSEFVIVEYPIYDPILLRESDDSYVVTWEVRAGFRRLVSVVRTNTKTMH